MTIKIPSNSYVTSDSHFGHKKIMQYQPNRKFLHLDHHNDYLIHAWNTTIPKDAHVFHLGDFFFYKSDTSLLSRLNGKITLIKGNHDNNNLPIPTFDYLQVMYNGIPIVLFHYPIESWNKMAHGSLHFHGHTHGRSRKILNRFDVGVDTHEALRPYSFEELVAKRCDKNQLEEIFNRPYR